MIKVEVDLIFNADVKKSSVALFAFEDDVVLELVLCLNMYCVLYLTILFFPISEICIFYHFCSINKKLN